MKKIRGLASSKLKTVSIKKIVVPRMKPPKPKRHIRIAAIPSYGFGVSRGSGYPNRGAVHTWCGLRQIPPTDTYTEEHNFLHAVRNRDNSSDTCSCCDNAIVRAIRQRILGI